MLTWAQGRVTLEVTGLGPDRLLARAREEGLTLYDLRRPGRTRLICGLSPGQARRWTALARELGLEVRTLGRWGLPRWQTALRARPALVIGLALGLLLVGWASTRVWEVTVVGAEGADARRLESFLAGEGLRFGVPRASVEVNRLEYRVRRAFPELIFAGIRLAGTRATVTVAPRPEPVPGEAAPGTALTAACPGIVERVTAERGVARVKPGEAVARGQLLIEGVTDDGGTPEPAAARGQVIARVWVTGEASAPLERVEPDPDGAVAQRWVLRLGHLCLPLSLGGAGETPVLVGMRAWRLPGFAAAAPLALEQRQYRAGRRARADEEALTRQLTSQSGAEALRKLPPDAEVLSRSQRISLEADTLTVTTTLVLRCDIARETLPTPPAQDNTAQRAAEWCGVALGKILGKSV